MPLTAILSPPKSPSPHPLRNRTIILVLLDTGIRATELCNLQIRHVDMKNSHIQVKGGKGDKERNVPFSARTGQILWPAYVRG